MRPFDLMSVGAPISIGFERSIDLVPLDAEAL